MYLYQNRISIYKKKYKINSDNQWEVVLENWKDIWADVTINIDKSKSVCYQFVTKFFCDFPRNFNVTLNGSMFNIIKAPIVDPQKRWIKFFAEKVEKGDN